jgi:ubiquitin-like domain-containing CTD phosphatase 1
MDIDTEFVTLEVAFGSERHTVQLAATASILDLREYLQDLLSVAAEKQKLLGLPGKPSDVDELGRLPLKRPVHKVMLVGTRDADLDRAKQLEAAAAEAFSDSVLNDLGDADDEDGGVDGDVSRNPTFLERIAKRIATYRPKVLAGFRPGKHTLVLDIDYTLLDHKR